MQATEISPELADAADVLSDQLRVHLERLAALLAPHVDRLERRFLRRLQRRKMEPKQRAALAALTPGAAARLFSTGCSPLKFIEQVEYNGRRLAKFNLPPASILAALEDYDRLLTPALRALIPREYTEFQWVRERTDSMVDLVVPKSLEIWASVTSGCQWELICHRPRSRECQRSRFTPVAEVLPPDSARATATALVAPWPRKPAARA